MRMHTHTHHPCCFPQVAYTFEKSAVMIPCCCLGPVVPAAMRWMLSRNLAAGLTDAMVDKGYPVCHPLPANATPTSGMAALAP